MLGSSDTNAFILITLLLGLGATAVTTLSPLLTPAMVVVAVHMTRLVQQNRQLSHDSAHDALLGLLNRRGFERLAERQFGEDRARNRPTSLLFADIDRFKEWNTTLGHVGGDKILQLVAKTIQEETRLGDLACRWGGEELVVLLPNTGSAAAEAVAERIRHAASEHMPTIERPAGGKPVKLGQDVRPCTISIGLATAWCDGKSMTDILKLADSAMQVAKDQGRNRVVVARGARSDEPTEDAM
jgi:diguanylate cyclase (GGDEF)-like protein